MSAFNPALFIEIPEALIPAAVEAAYDLSAPVGMGFLHMRPGPLDEETRDALISLDRDVVVRMDYVHGRQCKFTIRKREGKFYTDPEWYDHSRSQLVELLDWIGIEDAEAKVDAAVAARQESYA